MRDLPSARHHTKKSGGASRAQEGGTLCASSHSVLGPMFEFGSKAHFCEKAPHLGDGMVLPPAETSQGPGGDSGSWRRVRERCAGRSNPSPSPSRRRRPWAVGCGKKISDTKSKEEWVLTSTAGSGSDFRTHGRMRLTFVDNSPHSS